MTRPPLNKGFVQSVFDQQILFSYNENEVIVFFLLLINCFSQLQAIYAPFSHVKGSSFIEKETSFHSLVVNIMCKLDQKLYPQYNFCGCV